MPTNQELNIILKLKDELTAALGTAVQTAGQQIDQLGHRMKQFGRELTQVGRSLTFLGAQITAISFRCRLPSPRNTASRSATRSGS